MSSSLKYEDSVLSLISEFEPIFNLIYIDGYDYKFMTNDPIAATMERFMMSFFC